MTFKMEQLVGFGILLIILGFIVIVIGTLFGAKESSKAKVAFGGFIGFIPFGFGNDKRLVWFVTVLSLAILLTWIYFNFRILRGS